MAIIPIQNKYPDRAGYLGLNTDTNQLEVFSDGTYKPVGEPFSIFTENIDITVGPGGDFTDVNEALAYIQYLQPKFRTVTMVKQQGFHDRFNLDLQINLIFKEGYTFTNTIVIENRYIPYLNITQENLDVPLQINLTNDIPVAIGLFNSHIGNVTLNVENINDIHRCITPLHLVSSSIEELRFEVKNVEVGIYLSHSSVIREIRKFVSNQIYDYAIYLCYNCYAMVHASNSITSFTDNGITYPGNQNASAVWLTTSTLYWYHSGINPTIIDQSKRAFSVSKNSTLILSGNARFNISNIQKSVFHLNPVNGGSISVVNPITLGENVESIISPSDILVNTYNSNGTISARSTLTN